MGKVLKVRNIRWWDSDLEQVQVGSRFVDGLTGYYIEVKAINEDGTMTIEEGIDGNSDDFNQRYDAGFSPR